MVKIEIDGKTIEVPQGQMIIEAADSIGIPIPRFCYHKKLSIAANCRMCLVEVANAPKPLPACATPVSEGMKIFTTTNRALDAQKAVMEFLLINHPLDCPVCDQGGQCELQDVAMEYGKDTSRFTERKRVVADKNIGPLISTEMTRCIHCTRCVRFGSEVAGVREMGATGRGEFMKIGTYVEKSVNSEVSGNIIDLCPVGALTSKPFRFTARAWELISQPSISPHDCVGSHVFFHTRAGKVFRTLPREAEHLNEVWLSDRDRFGYEGFNHADRLTHPWIKQEGQWKQVDWVTALSFAVEKLRHIVQNDGAAQLGALLSANATLEESYLLQKLLRSQGCHNIDHRLRQTDYQHQNYVATFPTLGITLPELEQQENIILIGSDIRKEQPIIAMRVRKATTHGAKVFTINPYQIDMNFPVVEAPLCESGDFVSLLEQVVAALTSDQRIQPSPAALQMAQSLGNGEKTSILLGAYAWSHPQAHKIYYLSKQLAQHLNATWGEMSFGANSAGAALAGALPHRLPWGQTQPNAGLTAMQMLQNKLKGYLLLQCEPEYDCANPQMALQALQQAQTVVSLTSFDNPQLRAYADVLLPITPISEMGGTYVNAWGQWQHFAEAVLPLGESRPAWKVLRVLANVWEAPDFQYGELNEVLAEFQSLELANLPTGDTLSAMTLNPVPAQTKAPTALVRLAPIPLYAVDSVTRRAHALQQTQDGQIANVKLNRQEMENRSLKEGQPVWVVQDGFKSTTQIPIVLDEKIPNGVALVAAGSEPTTTLGAAFGMVELIQ